MDPGSSPGMTQASWMFQPERSGSLAFGAGQPGRAAPLAPAARIKGGGAKTGQFHGHQIVSGLVISHPVPKRLLILGEFFPAVLERL